MYPSPFISLLLLISLTTAQSLAEPIRVQHRVVHPNLPVTPWSELGTIITPSLHSISPLGSPATFSPSDTLRDDLVQFRELVDPLVEGAMYQVALDRPGVGDGVWPTSVVKACHLPESTSSHLTVHLSPSGLPFAVDHFVSPVPHDGSCPALDTTSRSYPVHNTTITLMSPRQPPQPELRTPPPLTAEGEPIASTPEKSFFQKYWIYVVIIIGVLLVSAPADEPGTSGGQAGR